MTHTHTHIHNYTCLYVLMQSVEHYDTHTHIPTYTITYVPVGVIM